MPSVSATILNSAMASLLGVSGDALTFKGNTINALVDRGQSFERPVPATFVELLQSSVAAAPVPGEQFTDNTNSTQFTVLFTKKVNGWYRCECYVLDDVPVENITIGGTTYSCHAFSVVTGTDLDLGGLTNADMVRVVIDRADISTIPAEGAAVTFRSTSYRVARVQRDQPGAPLILDIMDEVGGRR
jgi:hypothetical protein